MDRITKAVLATTFSLGLVAGVSVEAMGQVPEAAAPGAANEITIELGGAATGEAVLEAAGEQTQVMLEVSGAPAEGSLQGFLVSGRCGAGEDVIAELGAVTADAGGKGTLRAVVPVDLETISSTAVSVELRQADNALACGEHLALEGEIEAAPPAAEVPAPSIPNEPQAPAPATDPAADPAAVDPLIGGQP